MSVMAAAAVTTAAVGAYSAYNANKASKRAARAQDRQQEFAQLQYDDWQNTYGPIQDNLAQYYGSITPESVEAIGLEAIEGEYEVVRNNIEQSLAQRGITDSGVGLSLNKDIDISEAEAKANVRRNATGQAIAEQSKFLQIGMGNNPTDNMSNALSDQTRTTSAAAINASNQASQAIGTAIETAGKWAYNKWGNSNG